MLSSVFSCLETLMKHLSSFMKHFILLAIKSLHIERECFRKPQSFCYHFSEFLIHITWIVKRRRRYVSGLVRLKEVNTSLIYPRNKILSNPLNRDFEQSLNVVKPNPKRSLRPIGTREKYHKAMKTQCKNIDYLLRTTRVAKFLVILGQGLLERFSI